VCALLVWHIIAEESSIGGGEDCVDVQPAAHTPESLPMASFRRQPQQRKRPLHEHEGQNRHEDHGEDDNNLGLAPRSFFLVTATGRRRRRPPDR